MESKKTIYLIIFLICLAVAAYADGNWTENSSSVSTPGYRMMHRMAYHEALATVFLYGGNDYSSYYSDLWKFDNSGWTQESAFNSPSPDRDDCALSYVFIPDIDVSAIFLFGGFFLDSSLALNDTWLYDPGTLTWYDLSAFWSGCSSQPAARCGHALAYDPANNLVYMFGGVDHSTYYNDTWVFDPSVPNSGCPWTELSTTGVPYQRAYQAMCFDEGRGVIVMFGGQNTTSSYIFDDTWEFNPTTNRWTFINFTEKPSEREKAVMSYDSTVQVCILYGGFYSQFKDDKNRDTFFDETWEYNGVGPTWSEIFPSQNPGNRFETAMVFDKNQNKHILYGGIDSNYDIFSDTWEYGVSLTPTPTHTPFAIPTTGSTANAGLIIIFTCLLISLSLKPHQLKD